MSDENAIRTAIDDLKSLERDLFRDDGFEMWRDFEISIPLAISVLEEKLNGN